MINLSHETCACACACVSARLVLFSLPSSPFPPCPNRACVRADSKKKKYAPRSRDADASDFFVAHIHPDREYMVVRFLIFVFFSSFSPLVCVGTFALSCALDPFFCLASFARCRSVVAAPPPAINNIEKKKTNHERKTQQTTAWPATRRCSTAKATRRAWWRCLLVRACLSK